MEKPPNLLILDQNWNALVEISRESPQALQALKEVSESSSMPWYHIQMLDTSCQSHCSPLQLQLISTYSNPSDTDFGLSESAMNDINTYMKQAKDSREQLFAKISRDIESSLGTRKAEIEKEMIVLVECISVIEKSALMESEYFVISKKRKAELEKELEKVNAKLDGATESVRKAKIQVEAIIMKELGTIANGDNLATTHF